MKKLTKVVALSFLLSFAISSVFAAPVLIPASKGTVPASSAVVVPGKEKSAKTTMTKAEIKKESKNFKKEFGSSKKSGFGKTKITAAILAFFLGTLGVHSFYMGNKKKGFIQLGATVIGIALMVIGLANAVSTIDPITGTISKGSIGVALIGYILLAGVSIWAFIDFIRILTGGLEPEEGFDE